MYQILFVDDDLLLLRRLHQILDWEALNIEILPDKHDGAEALAYIENPKNKMPDIIITDINMPNLNGLEFAAKVRERCPNIHCIILTVNDSFQCAKEAVNIGVSHYLLKPLDHDELYRLIGKILHAIETSKEQEQYQASLESKVSLNERIIKENFLNWVASGYYPLNREQLKQKFEFYQIPISADAFQILLIQINAADNHSLLQEIHRQLDDFLCSYQNCFLFVDPFNQFNLLIGLSTDPVQKINTTYLANSIQNFLAGTLNQPAAIFISRVYHEYHNIYRCYYDTKFLSEYMRDNEFVTVMSYDDYHLLTDDTMNLDETRTTILKYLRTKDMENLKQYTHSLLYSSFSDTGYESFYILCVDMILTGVIFLQESKTAVADVFGRHFYPLQEIMVRREFQECESFILLFYSSITDYMKNIKITSSQRLTEKCLELIEQNLGSFDLSVKWLASQLYIHESHLSRQFKKEQGISLVQYIRQQRLAAAKNLLENGYKNLQEVAHLVGFQDALYFSKCFKKEYGVSPSAYSERF